MKRVVTFDCRFELSRQRPGALRMGLDLALDTLGFAVVEKDRGRQGGQGAEERVQEPVVQERQVVFAGGAGCF